MHNTTIHNPANQPDTILGSFAKRLCVIAWSIGVLGLIGGIVLGRQCDDGWTCFSYSYLLNYCFFLSISLGALFCVALDHATRTGWNVVVRRLAEIMAANFPCLTLLFLPIIVPVLLGSHSLYAWNDPSAVAGEPLLRHKAPYLSAGFFGVRAVIYLAAWWLLGRFFLTRSLEQDRSGDPALTLRMERLSPVALLLCAVTVTFASFDWLMSLSPRWSSTIFGVYFYSGAVVGFVAAIILAAIVLQLLGRLKSLPSPFGRGAGGEGGTQHDEVISPGSALTLTLSQRERGPISLSTAITVEHYHDLGKLLFAFVIFWGYIAFSQYLLIWYANIPEETEWYLVRQSGPWLRVSLVLLFGGLLIPFCGLLSRHGKRRRWSLAFWAVWLLAMHWLDLYWIIMPNLVVRGNAQLAAAIDVCLFVGIGGVYLAGLLHLAGQHPLLPVADPRLGESLAFENN